MAGLGRRGRFGHQPYHFDTISVKFVKIRACANNNYRNARNPETREQYRFKTKIQTASRGIPDSGFGQPIQLKMLSNITYSSNVIVV